MTKPIPKPQEQPEGPAKITDMHVQDRHLDKVGDRRGWSLLMPYEKAHRAGKLVCREKCTSAAATEAEVIKAFDRYQAAKAFDEGWRVCNASWPAGFNLDRVRALGCPGGFADFQRDSKAYWRRIELKMGTRDWMICRRVCGEGYAIAEAVTAISPSYKDSTLARFREALDALVEARA